MKIKSKEENKKPESFKFKSKPITFYGMLLILFLGLKLSGNIDWNWFLVFSPIILNITVRFFQFILLYPIFKYIEKLEKEEKEKIK